MLFCELGWNGPADNRAQVMLNILHNNEKDFEFFLLAFSYGSYDVIKFRRIRTLFIMRWQLSHDLNLSINFAALINGFKYISDKFDSTILPSCFILSLDYLPKGAITK